MSENDMNNMMKSMGGLQGIAKQFMNVDIEETKKKLEEQDKRVINIEKIVYENYKMLQRLYNDKYGKANSEHNKKSG